VSRDYPKRPDAPLLEIEWYDIQDDDDWNDEGDPDFYAAHCVSVGYRIFEDKFVVIIARTYSEDMESWSEKRAIPKGVIIDQRVMEPAPTKKEKR